MTFARVIEDFGMMLLVVLLVPIVLLAVGAPVALLARLMIEIAQWL